MATTQQHPRRGPTITTKAEIRLLGVGRRPPQVDYEARRDSDVRRFVPHTSVHRPTGNLSTQNLGELINMDKRFYLPHVDENARRAQATLIDASMPEDGPAYGDLGVLAEFNDFNNKESVLDLGTVALQRIVTQMKGLHFEDTPNFDSYVPNAAKLGGLKSYSDYLLGVDQVDTRAHFE